MSIRLVGELYNYQLIEHSMIFETLYTLITLGHEEENSLGQEIDPKDDSFRIRLVCTLLLTCGQFFNRGVTKERLDRFLIYFQRYILNKHWRSLEVEYMIDDTFAALRPEAKRYTNIEQIQAVIEKIESGIFGSQSSKYKYDVLLSAPYQVRDPKVEIKWDENVNTGEEEEEIQRDENASGTVQNEDPEDQEFQKMYEEMMMMSLREKAAENTTAPSSLIDIPRFKPKRGKTDTKSIFHSSEQFLFTFFFFC